MDAGAYDYFVTTVLTCPSYPVLNKSCAYESLHALPSLLAELTALRDGLQALASALTTGDELELYTDPTATMRDSGSVARCTSLAARIHEIINTYSCPIRVSRIRRRIVSAHAAVDRACHRDLPQPLLLIPVSTIELLVEKKTLRRATGALLPPRRTDLPSGLAR